MWFAVFPLGAAPQLLNCSMSLLAPSSLSTLIILNAGTCAGGSLKWTVITALIKTPSPLITLAREVCSPAPPQLNPDEGQTDNVECKPREFRETDGLWKFLFLLSKCQNPMLSTPWHYQNLPFLISLAQSGTMSMRSSGGVKTIFLTRRQHAVSDFSAGRLVWGRLCRVTLLVPTLGGFYCTLW